MPDVVAEGGWSSAAVPTAIYVHTAEDRRRMIAEAVSPLRGAATPLPSPAPTPEMPSSQGNPNPLTSSADQRNRDR